MGETHFSLENPAAIVAEQLILWTTGEQFFPMTHRSWPFNIKMTYWNWLRNSNAIVLFIKKKHRSQMYLYFFTGESWLVQYGNDHDLWSSSQQSLYYMYISIGKKITRWNLTMSWSSEGSQELFVKKMMRSWHLLPTTFNILMQTFFRLCTQSWLWLKLDSLSVCFRWLGGSQQIWQASRGSKQPAISPETNSVLVGRWWTQS